MEEEARSDRRGPRAAAWTALALLVAVAVRLALLWAPPAELAADAVATWEELHRGNVAHELARGPLRPILEYQWNAAWGGSLAIGVLAVPLFAALGESLFVLRLATLPFLLLAIVAAAALARRAAGERAARAAAFLVACAPPSFALLGARAWGTHVESAALALALAWGFERFHARGGVSRGGSFALGLAAGLGAWFGPPLALAALVLALFELPWWKVPLAPGFGPRIARLCGLMIGLAPLALVLAGGAPPALPRRPSVALARRALGTSEDLPRALGFPDLAGVDGALLGLAYLALAGSAAAYAAWRAFAGAPWPGRRLARIALAQAAALAALELAAGAGIEAHIGAFGARYLAAPWLWLALLAALAAGAAPRPRPFLVALLAAAVLAFAGSAARLRPAAAGSLLASEGRSTRRLGFFLAERLVEREGALAELAAALQRRPPREREDLALALGQRWRRRALGAAAPQGTAEGRALATMHALVPPGLALYFEQDDCGASRYRGARCAEYRRRWREAHPERSSPLEPGR